MGMGNQRGGREGWSPCAGRGKRHSPATPKGHSKVAPHDGELAPLTSYIDPYAGACTSHALTPHAGDCTPHESRCRGLLGVLAGRCPCMHWHPAGRLSATDEGARHVGDYPLQGHPPCFGLVHLSKSSALIQRQGGMRTHLGPTCSPEGNRWAVHGPKLIRHGMPPCRSPDSTGSQEGVG